MTRPGKEIKLSPSVFKFNKGLLTAEEITDFLYNALKEIEVEEGIRLSDRAFIADHLAPKLAKQQQPVK